MCRCSRPANFVVNLSLCPWHRRCRAAVAARAARRRARIAGRPRLPRLSRTPKSIENSWAYQQYPGASDRLYTAAWSAGLRASCCLNAAEPNIHRRIRADWPRSRRPPPPGIFGAADARRVAAGLALPACDLATELARSPPDFDRRPRSRSPCRLMVILAKVPIP